MTVTELEQLIRPFMDQNPEVVIEVEIGQYDHQVAIAGVQMRSSDHSPVDVVLVIHS